MEFDYGTIEFLGRIINDLLGGGDLKNGRADLQLDAISREFSTIDEVHKFMDLVYELWSNV